jgi:GMP synthase (glutamine-hydrolysing)
MVTERLPWSEQAAEWLREAVSARVPVLGICYGHQLLAYAHGGRVGDNPRGREYGTVQVALDGEAARDRLLGGMPARFPAQEGHTQSVLSLPRGAVRLASNPWDPHQAFRLGDRAWGVQFHPEFDADIMREYLGHVGETLSAEGQDPQALSVSVRDDPAGPAILRRFVELCEYLRKEC